MKKRMIGAVASVVLFGAGSALAQSGSLVSVDISNVANNIAKNINVDVSQIPVNVQVPVDVAANVCGVGVNVLGTQAASGNAQCTAKSTSEALNQTVLRQVKGTTQR
jgi:hypothetical protein